jgi:hypothetical protein
MAFTGREEHSISLEDAARLTKRYRDSAPAEAIKGGFFGKEAFLEILDQEDCVGIRYYYGLDANNTKVLVLVGVKENEDDIDNGILKEAAQLCPPRCSKINPLNS